MKRRTFLKRLTASLGVTTIPAILLSQKNQKPYVIYGTPNNFTPPSNSPAPFYVAGVDPASDTPSRGAKVYVYKYGDSTFWLSEEQQKIYDAEQGK